MVERYRKYYDWTLQSEHPISDVFETYDYFTLECIFKDRLTRIISVDWNQSSYSWTDNDGEEYFEEYADIWIKDQESNTINENDVVYWRIIGEDFVIE